MTNDIRKFTLELDDFVRKVELAPATVVKRVAFDLFGRIIRKTPVDTGRARASWTIDVNEADRRVQPEEAIRYPIPTVGLLDVQPGDSVIISNNLPYIGELEHGHSQQAPAGMVAVSIAEVELGLQRLIREGLQDAGL